MAYCSFTGQLSHLGKISVLGNINETTHRALTIKCIWSHVSDGQCELRYEPWPCHHHHPYNIQASNSHNVKRPIRDIYNNTVIIYRGFIVNSFFLRMTTLNVSSLAIVTLPWISIVREVTLHGVSVSSSARVLSHLGMYNHHIIYRKLTFGFEGNICALWFMKRKA